MITSAKQAGNLSVQALIADITLTTLTINSTDMGAYSDAAGGYAAIPVNITVSNISFDLGLIANYQENRVIKVAGEFPPGSSILVRNCSMILEMSASRIESISGVQFDSLSLMGGSTAIFTENTIRLLIVSNQSIAVHTFSVFGMKLWTITNNSIFSINGNTLECNGTSTDVHGGTRAIWVSFYKLEKVKLL
jgi:hypothetical protein